MDEAASSLAALAAAISRQTLPPVERWHPTRCGDSHMRIAADGTWFYRDSPIQRPEMVRLFSTVLRREADGGFVLVTPVEKLDIAVEDAPFVATALVSEGEGAQRRLGFRLNTGDAVIAGPDHQLHVGTTADGSPRPYIGVRAGLDALIARPVYYELAELALAEDAAAPALWSEGVRFPLEPR